VFQQQVNHVHIALCNGDMQRGLVHVANGVKVGTDFDEYASTFYISAPSHDVQGGVTFGTAAGKGDWNQ
jgi:hypothetical protein